MHEMTPGCSVTVSVLINNFVIKVTHCYMDTEIGIATKHAISRCTPMGSVLSYAVDDTVNVWKIVPEEELPF